MVLVQFPLLANLYRFVQTGFGWVTVAGPDPSLAPPEKVGLEKVGRAAPFETSAGVAGSRAASDTGSEVPPSELASLSPRPLTADARDSAEVAGAILCEVVISTD